MVSKTVIAMLFGQIILALIFFYFLPISGATENAPKLINTKSQPIITLSQGKWIFLFIIPISIASCSNFSNNHQPIEVVQGCWTKFIQNPLLLVSAGVELPSKLSV